MIDAALDEQGNIWPLVTRNGKADPGGKGGFVLPGMASGCRWVKYVAADHGWSMERFRDATEFHHGA